MNKRTAMELIIIVKVYQLDKFSSKDVNLIGKLKLLKNILKKENNYTVKIRSRLIKNKKKKLKNLRRKVLVKRRKEML